MTHRGLFVRTRDADSFYALLLNRLVARARASTSRRSPPPTRTCKRSTGT